MKYPSLGIRRVFPRRIWQQIFFILFFLVLIPLVILGFLLLRTSQNAIKTTILRDHKEIALHATGEIREHIKGARGVLSVTASILGTLQADPWRQETIITELSLKNPAFQRISSLNLKGKEIATSLLGTELRDRSGEKAFQEASSGLSYLSEIRISENHIPFLTIAEPIKQVGKIKGVLIAGLNVRSVWDIIDAIRVGQLGVATLIDRQGRIIAHHDKKKVLENASLTQARVIQDVLSGQAGNFAEVDENGESWLISYAPVKNLNWGLIIAQPEREVFAFSREMNAQFLIIIVLSILGTLLVSLILAHYMSRPMRDIIKRTERIARGDFSRSFRIRSKSEIDKLLFSFNRMTHKLRKAQEDEKLTIIGRAASATVHELKNSLQLVDTFVKLLPQRLGDKEFIKEFSDTMPRELDSWSASLKNMMTFSGDASFPTQELDITGIIRKIILLTKLKTRQSEIRLEVDLEDSLPLIMGHEEKLKQVFLNILNNALDATPRGDRVVLSTRSVNDSHPTGFCSVEIEFMNTGKGIEQKELDKIFEPFYTTKSGGLGLGLSISKEVIGLHNGNIKVVSTRNKTTSFIVRIPAINTVVERDTPAPDPINASDPLRKT